MDHRSIWHMLDMSHLDVQVYRQLLTAGPSPVSAIVELIKNADDPYATPCSDNEVARAVENLARLGLVRRPRPKGQVTALDPRATLVPLARQRQVILDGVASVADELASHQIAHRNDASLSALVQVLEGEDEIVGRLVSMFSGATETAVSLVAPPYVSDLNSDLERAEASMLERGVDMRAVYDTTFVHDQVHLENLRAGIRGGEHARLFEGLRTKMILVDGSVAVLPLPARRPGAPRAISVAHSSLTDALTLMFELLWARAAPAPDMNPRRRSAGDARHDIIEMLRTGVSDASIARSLGISERTVRRQVALLQDEYYATSRFQLGWILGDSAHLK